VYTSISGQVAVSRQLELIANNLANMGTVGYKSERPLFEKVLASHDPLLSSSLRKDIAAPNPFQTNEFASLKGSFSDLSQGPIEMTGNSLDVAIDGPGYFVVQTSQGERYTRSGNFKLDGENRLVTQTGQTVMGSGGDITISGSNVSVANDGSIVVDGKEVGKLRLVTFDANAAQREAGQLFAASSVSEITDPKVQG